MVKKENNKKSSSNIILWFLFAIVIPIMVVGTLILFILSIVGVDVSGWLKEKGSQVPVVSSFIETDIEKDLTEKIMQLEGTIEKQQAEIKDLQSENDDLQATITDHEQEKEKIKNQEKSKAELAKTEKEDMQNQAVKQASASFRKMNKQKAAQIIQSMEKDDAVEILKELSNNVRGGILEEMEPKQAAYFTEIIMNEP